MNTELTKFIFLIIDIQKLINKQWIEDKRYIKYNMRRYEVRDILEDPILQKMIFDYREFISTNELILKICDILRKTKSISARAKAYNSLQYKIQNYIKNHDYGRESINKCLNDIFGFRIILEDSVLNEEIKETIEEFNKNNERNIRYLEVQRDKYKAIHVYFKIDNYSFNWELQIWKKKDVKNNIKSHSIYKQDYIKWESKGGE